jgi:hypothetical protein
LYKDDFNLRLGNFNKVIVNVLKDIGELQVKVHVLENFVKMQMAGKEIIRDPDYIDSDGNRHFTGKDDFPGPTRVVDRDLWKVPYKPESQGELGKYTQEVPRNQEK